MSGERDINPETPLLWWTILTYLHRRYEMAPRVRPCASYTDMKLNRATSLDEGERERERERETERERQSESE